METVYILGGYSTTKAFLWGLTIGVFMMLVGWSVKDMVKEYFKKDETM